jgi:Flp pilus assembly protein TadG
MINDQSGAVAVMTVLTMVMFLGFSALSLDIGHLLMAQNQLQRAADAASLAGARGLWPDVLPVVNSSPGPDCATGNSRANYVATHLSNRVDGAVLSADEVTVQVGYYNSSTKTFTPGCSANTNAVKVTCRRTVRNILFAQRFGIHSADLSATAIALMGFASGIGQGALPIAINKIFVTPGQVLFINFTPDPLDTGGWFADPPQSANARTFRDYVENGSCPPLRVGDIINLQNGQDTSVLQALQQKLTEHGGTWDTFLPVVDTDRFNQSEPIVAFVPFRITEVIDTGGRKGITGTVLGLAIFSGAEPGGTDNLGLLSPPKAVY